MDGHTEKHLLEAIKENSKDLLSKQRTEFHNEKRKRGRKLESTFSFRLATEKLKPSVYVCHAFARQSLHVASETTVGRFCYFAASLRDGALINIDPRCQTQLQFASGVKPQGDARSLHWVERCSMTCSLIRLP